MKRRVVFAIITAILFIIAIGVILFAVQLARVGSRTLIVPDDYAQISWALGNATSGDTVYVRSGTYNERGLVIDKPLSLIGEDSSTTILIGGFEGITGGGQTIWIKAEKVIVSGFTIRSYNFQTPAWYFDGISISGNNCKVTDNIFENCNSGVISGDPVSSILVSNNTLRDNTWGGGIQFIYASSHDVTIVDNNITSNFIGIGVGEDSTSFIISGNSITNNTDVGISLAASNSTIAGNNVTSNRGSRGNGIFVQGSNNIFSGNYVADNAVGVIFSGSNANGNTFFNNSFVNNDQNLQINAVSYIEAWDHGSLGNYWSDYTTKYPNATEVDNTRVWNTPYVIDRNNVDHYPLIHLFTIQ